MSENQAITTAPETSYEKGESFEILFAEFMKSDLGWDKYVIRSQQKGKANSKGSQVDIIAERKDDRYRKLYNLGLLLSIIAIAGIIIGISISVLAEDEIGFYIMFLSFIPAGGGIYSFWDCEHYHKENAWVECKNRKTKSTFEQVKKSIDEYNDYKASGDKEYKYIEHYFVSRTGFVENALKLANDNGLICYTYENKKFEKITYWK